MAEYFRSFGHELSQDNGISYEDINGTVIQVLAPAQSREVKKTVWQTEKTPPLSVGDLFDAAGVVSTCTKISVSDDVVAVNGKTPTRLWRFDISGVEGIYPSAAKYGRDRSISRKLNGVVETALDGETVILKRSNTPQETVKITSYSTSETPPVSVGASHDGGVVLNVDSTKTVIERDGFKIVELWRHEVEVVR